MTGTPLDLTPFGPLLSALGLLYWGLAAAVAAFALWYPKRWLLKVSFAALVLAAFAYPAVRHAHMRQGQRDESKAKLDAAMALFAERCKKAGEKITHTVENVDGVVWMRWREKRTSLSDQFRLDDPYGRDCSDEDCIARLLRVTEGAALNPEEARRHKIGYQFVETRDPQDGLLYRYTARIDQGWNPEAIERHKRETGGPPPLYSYRFKIDRQRVDSLGSRYGITWDDVSTREDRDHWIAGGMLRLIELQTSEVIAFRTGYIIDTGQGDTTGFRDPWGWAWSYGPRCPPVFERSWNFVTKVLQPTRQGD